MGKDQRSRSGVDRTEGLTGKEKDLWFRGPTWRATLARCRCHRYARFMPHKQPLKVFCTPAGFYDAYVAAPSQKAALTAWGSKHDLFARGLAERVDDPELMREALDRPGVVIRRLRGSAEQQMASLPKTRGGTKRSATSKTERAEKKQRPRNTRPPVGNTSKIRPRPDRADLIEAERSVRETRKKHAEEKKALEKRKRELEREIRKQEQRHATEERKAQRRAQNLRSQYEAALRDWNA